MIYVTCGHEDGVGLEVFLKSYLALTNDCQRNIALICPQQILTETANSLALDDIKITNIDIEVKNNPTIDTLIYAINITTEKDILITLPSSKDQFIWNEKTFGGHTSFFRAFYNSDDIVMTFTRGDEHLLLLTDHVPLVDVTKNLNNCDKIVKKINTVYKGISSFSRIEKIYISGINPHAGEDGLLGTEDKIISDVINKLSFQAHGPISGDTMHFMLGKNTLGVFAHHDQALSYFKSKFAVYGMNITHGLPFLRLSPDFGTAAHLKGKRLAHYGGMLELLKFANNHHENR